MYVFVVVILTNTIIRRHRYNIKADLDIFVHIFTRRERDLHEIYGYPIDSSSTWRDRHILLG